MVEELGVWGVSCGIVGSLKLDVMGGFILRKLVNIKIGVCSGCFF